MTKRFSIFRNLDLESIPLYGESFISVSHETCILEGTHAVHGGIHYINKIHGQKMKYLLMSKNFKYFEKKGLRPTYAKEI